MATPVTNSRPLLMPKATAVWLVENTVLTFRQIADFCRLHELEVKGIADGDVATGIKGTDPLGNGQLTRKELDKGQADPGYRMKMAEPKVDVPVFKPRRGPRYTPVSRRKDRPDAIAWLMRYHPELSDGQIIKLVGTTKPTVVAIRERTHWNSSNIKPVDPVTLGLCSQLDLDQAVRKSAKKAAKMRAERGETGAPEPTLLPASETVAEPAAGVLPATPPAPEAPEPTAESAFGSFTEKPAAKKPQAEPEPDAESVFAKLKDLKPAEPPEKG